jgi:hypothetical protein
MLQMVVSSTQNHWNLDFIPFMAFQKHERTQQFRICLCVHHHVWVGDTYLVEFVISNLNQSLESSLSDGHKFAGVSHTSRDERKQTHAQNCFVLLFCLTAVLSTKRRTQSLRAGRFCPKTRPSATESSLPAGPSLVWQLATDAVCRC